MLKNLMKSFVCRRSESGQNGKAAQACHFPQTRNLNGQLLPKTYFENLLTSVPKYGLRLRREHDLAVFSHPGQQG